MALWFPDKKKLMKFYYTSPLENKICSVVFRNRNRLAGSASISHSFFFFNFIWLIQTNYKFKLFIIKSSDEIHRNPMKSDESKNWVFKKVCKQCLKPWNIITDAHCNKFDGLMLLNASMIIKWRPVLWIANVLGMI